MSETPLAMRWRLAELVAYACETRSVVVSRNDMTILRFLIPALALALSSRAEARLGWTMSESEGKYGEATIIAPTGKQFKDSSVEATFRYEGWRIKMAWFPGTNKAQFIRYTAEAPKMTNAQLDSILASNADGQKWEPHFDGQNKSGVAISSALSGSDMRSGYFQREDGALTDTIMLWAVNNVAIRSAWLIALEKRNKDAEAAKNARVPNL